MICILCLEQPKPAQGQIKVFSEKGLQLNICGIISRHFWLRPNSALHNELICMSCWSVVRDFHCFYQRVVEAHNHLETKFTYMTEDDDPLPHEMLLKSEEVNSAGKLVEALGENFFDSEVKVEVNDLDLLPQIEVIEDVPNVAVKSLRASRRGRQGPNNATAKSYHTAKRIKRESSPHNALNDDSEPEISLAALRKKCKIKTDSNEDLGQICLSAKAEEPAESLITTDRTEPQKKRRGRPKKIKEEGDANAISEVQNDTTVQISDDHPVKAEVAMSDNELDNDNEFMTLDKDSGTEDSSSSSSSNDSDSKDSLPEPEPEERYAEIPRRVVVKPKKYRKRPKPLVPPKRMSREEIDRKNAQQAEYDKVILQFFGKFSCARCSLLVQNFGDMRRHFRASHNEDPGYMMCCGRKFHQRKALAEHIFVHWNPEHFKCPTCTRIFQDGRALEVHELTHTNPPEPKEKKVFQCDKCPKFFTTKAAFEYHSFSKHVPKSEFKFGCTICNKKLPTSRKLKDHIKYMHDPESAIICDKCGKQVRSQSNLKKHHQIEHSDVPRPVPIPMQCEICGTWLRHMAGLKQHMKTIHEDIGGEHRCHICNKTSTNSRALKRHIYHNHECERKFKCTMCEKAFKRPQDLREHTSTHTGEVLYTCPNCPMTFFSNANMYKHRQRLHRAEYEADRKKPVPPNIMQQAVGATAAMKMQQAVGATSAFFAQKLRVQPIAQQVNRLVRTDNTAQTNVMQQTVDASADIKMQQAVGATSAFFAHKMRIQPTEQHASAEVQANTTQTSIN